MSQTEWDQLRADLKTDLQLAETKENAYITLCKLYGKKLDLSSPEEIERFFNKPEPEGFKNILVSPNSFNCSTSDSFELFRKLAKLTSDMMGGDLPLHYLVKNVDVEGPFDIPPDCTLVDIPGLQDSENDPLMKERVRNALLSCHPPLRSR